MGRVLPGGKTDFFSMAEFWKESTTYTYLYLLGSGLSKTPQRRFVANFSKIFEILRTPCRSVRITPCEAH